MAYQLDPSKVLIWQAGRPAELWMSHRQWVGEFIDKYQLRPLTPDGYPYYQAPGHLAEPVIHAAAEHSERAESRPKWPWPWPFPGGIRIPHFHFGPDVYLVERKQWEEFSNRVVKDLQERLAQAKEISFEQTLALSEAVTAIR
jgi:hypothetical protein